MSATPMKRLMARIGDRVFVRNALWMLLGQLLRLLVQGCYFVLLARTLGVRDYGAFIGVVAFVAIAAPFASLGGGGVLVQHVARDRAALPRALGDALVLLAFSASVLLVIILLLAGFALPGAIAPRLVLTVAVAELFGVRLLELCGQVFQSFERLGRSALLLVALSAARAAAIGVLVLLHHRPDPLQWACWYLGATAMAALFAIGLVLVEIGRPRFRLRGLLGVAQQGVFFSIGLSAQTVYNDVDKTMLARLDSLEATGIYGSAYKVVDISFLPVSALLYASYPRFVERGASGIAASLAYARKLFPLAAGAALCATAVVWVAAPWVPWLLGDDFARSVSALRWLAPLTVVRAAHYLLAYALTGAGHQRARSIVQLAVAGANVAVNLWLIPNWSWRGAAWASLGCDVLLAVALGVCCWRVARD